MEFFFFFFLTNILHSRVVQLFIELAPLCARKHIVHECSLSIHFMLFLQTTFVFFLHSNDKSNKQLANSKSNFCLFPFPFFIVAHECDKHCCRTFYMKICISRGLSNYHVYGSLILSYSPWAGSHNPWIPFRNLNYANEIKAFSPIKPVKVFCISFWFANFREGERENA